MNSSVPCSLALTFSWGGLLGDEPQALIWVGFSERQLHQHHSDLITRGAAPLQRHWHARRQTGGDRLTRGSQRSPESRCRSGKERVVDRATAQADARLERVDVGAQEDDAAVRTALTQQHGAAHVTAAQCLADATQTDTQPTQRVPKTATRGHHRRSATRFVRRHLSWFVRIEQLLHDRDRRHPVGDGVMDAQHDPIVGTFRAAYRGCAGSRGPDRSSLSRAVM